MFVWTAGYVHQNNRSQVYTILYMQCDRTSVQLLFAPSPEAERALTVSMSGDEAMGGDGLDHVGGQVRDFGLRCSTCNKECKRSELLLDQEDPSFMWQGGLVLQCYQRVQDRYTRKRFKSMV